MKIKLSDNFTYKRLLHFAFPSIVMLIFMSIYGVVDGLFVSNFVGKTAFASVNLFMPIFMILGSVGFMLGTGGSAIISRTIGQGNNKKANELFSMFVYVSIVLGVVIMILGLVFVRKISELLGAEGQMLEDCVTYGKFLLIALPFYVLQMEFQSFFVTAEKAKLGLVATIAAGVTNIILDAVFVAGLNLGLAGAAIATVLGCAVGGIIPLIYFSRSNSSLLRLSKVHLDFKSLGGACVNGSSELMSNISMSVVSILYNIQLLKYAGENGVSAYGVLMYLNLVFISTFIGYSIGIAPIIGYHYGAKNREELKSLLRKSLVIISIFSVCMVAIAEGLALPLSKLFVGYDAALLDLTRRGFIIYSFSFLFAGIAVFGSSFFTALSDGLTSALISFLRTLIFQIIAVMLLPLIMGIDGIWLSIVVAEFLAFIVTFAFMILKKKKFGY